MKREQVTLTASGIVLIPLSSGNCAAIQLKAESFTGTVDFETTAVAAEYRNAVYQDVSLTTRVNTKAQITFVVDGDPKEYLLLPPFRQGRVRVVLTGGSLKVSWSEQQIESWPA